MLHGDPVCMYVYVCNTMYVCMCVCNATGMPLFKHTSCGCDVTSMHVQ